MKYTGIELLQAIKDKKIKDGTKFKCDRFGATDIYVKYETGELNIYQGKERYEEKTKYGVISPKDLLTFTFKVIKEKPKKIEKLDIEENAMNRSERYIRKEDNKIVNLSVGDYEIANKVNEIIDYLLEKESDK